MDIGDITYGLYGFYNIHVCGIYIYIMFIRKNIYLSNLVLIWFLHDILYASMFHRNHTVIGNIFSWGYDVSQGSVPVRTRS